MLQPIKKSFEPFSNADSTVLILGSLPGDKSLELSEYYAHPRNRFWKVIVTITASELPATFADKKNLLLSKTIALWDVAHSAQRKGSLDSAIENVVPNDLDAFIAQHKKLKTIAFNGLKSQALYDKYFERNKAIRYLVLPSTSPANAGISFEALCAVWKQILE
jgi:hypoxanthine-DNA glycosylase